jgi:hypothetical protein
MLLVPMRDRIQKLRWMTKPQRIFNRFLDTLELLSHWLFVAGAGASALAVIAAVVLAILSGYTNRVDLAGAAGSLFGKGIIGFFVFLILARQSRKQRAQSKEMRALDDKWEELARMIEEGKKRASAQGSGAENSG